MSSAPTAPATPAPVTPSASFFVKLWDKIKAMTKIVEDDLAKILGSNAAADLEAIGKTLLNSWVGPLATQAMTEATDVISGKMSVSAAVTGLVSLAESNGKTLTQQAALQAVALLQNAVPYAGPSVTPTA